MISTTPYRKVKEKLAQALAAGGGGGGNIPAYRSHSSLVQKGVSQISPGAPAGAVAGDLLLLFGFGLTDSGGGVSISNTGGQTWTQVVNYVGTFPWIVGWWAVFTGSGSLAAVEVTQNYSGAWTILQAAYTDVDGSTPMDVTAQITHTEPGTNVAVPALTTVTDNALRVVFAADYAGISSTSAFTGVPASLTLRENVGDSFWPQSDYLGDVVQAVAGATPSENFTHGNHYTAVAHLALRPAP